MGKYEIELDDFLVTTPMAGLIKSAKNCTSSEHLIEEIIIELKERMVSGKIVA